MEIVISWLKSLSSFTISTFKRMIMKPYIPIVAVALTLSACSSMPFGNKDKQPPIQVGGMDVPSWFLTVPEDTSDSIYAVGTGYSDDLQFSIDKAMHEAKVGLADKISARTTAEVKTYTTDSAKGGQGVSASKATKLAKSGFSNVDVSDYVVKHRMVIMDGSYYRTFIQMSVDPTNRDQQVSSFSNNDESEADKALENF